MQTGVTPRGPKREIGGLREFGWRERAEMRNAKECFFIIIGAMLAYYIDVRS